MKIVLDNGKELVLSDELAKQINEEIVKAETKKSTGWERVAEDKTYHALMADGTTFEIGDTYDEDDDVYYNNANYFASKELAEKVAFRQTLERKLMRFSAEHDGDKIDWDDNDSGKHYLYYDFSSHKLIVSNNYDLIRFGQVYFHKKETVQLAIETFKDDLIKYFTEYRL